MDTLAKLLPQYITIGTPVTIKYKGHTFLDVTANPSAGKKYALLGNVPGVMSIFVWTTEELDPIAKEGKYETEQALEALITKVFERLGNRHEDTEIIVPIMSFYAPIALGDKLLPKVVTQDNGGSFTLSEWIQTIKQK